jgi:hypothetical protein
VKDLVQNPRINTKNRKEIRELVMLCLKDREVKVRFNSRKSSGTSNAELGRKSMKYRVINGIKSSGEIKKACMRRSAIIC